MYIYHINLISGYETDENRIYWWIFDYMCDLIYIIDILLVKNRVQFINNGMLEVSNLKHSNRDVLIKL